MIILVTQRAIWMCHFKFYQLIGVCLSSFYVIQIQITLYYSLTPAMIDFCQPVTEHHSFSIALLP